MRRSIVHRAVGALLIAALVTPLSLAGTTSAQLRGRVMAEDGTTPRQGVTIALYDAASETTYRSAPTGKDGLFEIDSAPVGRYAMIAETDSTAYLAHNRVDLQSEANPPVALTLRKTRINASAGAGAGAGAGVASWVPWVIGGVIAVGGLLVITEITDDDDEGPASAF